MFIAQFFKASSLKKKIRSITFIVWVLGKVEKSALKKVKKELKIFFFVKNKYLSVTLVSTPIFQGLLKKYSFQICSFSHKKCVDYFRLFFTHSGLFTALCPTLCIKNPLNYYWLKVNKFYGGIVKNESARTKKTRGGAKRPLPPARLGLNITVVGNNINIMKTTFDFNFDFYKASKQHEYSTTWKQREALHNV